MHSSRGGSSRDPRRRCLWLLLVAALLAGAVPPLAAAQSLVDPGLGPPESYREVRMPTLAYFEGPEGEGGWHDVYRVLIGRNPVRQLRVGFYEDFPGGVGPNWRYAAWLAATVASRVAGISLDEVTVVFDTRQQFDGPSDGLIMTLAVLAGLLEEEPRPDVAGTGAINPDGSIGPVGGISHKITAAGQAGYRTVLIPMGERFEKTAAGETIDLVAHGRSLGVEVLEVRDIYEAYAAISGRELPRRRLPSRLSTALPEAFEDALRSAYDAAAGRVQEYTRQLAGLRQRPDDALAAYLEESREAAAAGQMALAYHQLLNAEAVALQQLILAQTRVEQLAERGDVGGLRRVLTSLSETLDETTAALEEVGAALEEAVAPDWARLPLMLDLYGWAAEAEIAGSLGYAALAAAEEGLGQRGGRRSGSGGNGTEAGEHLITAAYWTARYQALLNRLLDGLQLADAVPASGSAPEAATVTRVAARQRAVAHAVLRYFDELVLEEIAEAQGVTRSRAQEIFGAADRDYALTALLDGVLAQPDDDRAYLVLASSLRVEQRANFLVNFYYSILDMAGDGDGATAREETLSHMLRLAEEQARASIARAQAAGIEPGISLLYLQAGAGLSQGDTADRLDALRVLWQAEALARTVADLAQ